MESTRPRKPSSEAVARGYEDTQPTLRGMLLFLVCFIAAAVILHFVLGWMYLLLIGVAPSTPSSPVAGRTVEQSRSHAAQGPSRVQAPLIPPQPRLQPSAALSETPLENVPAADMARFRRRENELLNSYSVNALQGTISIPIDEAMRLVAHRIPTRPSTRPQRPAPRDSGGFR